MAHLVLNRLLWLEAATLLLGLILVEASVMLMELRRAIILDWFVTIVPLIWLNVSILFVFLFVRLGFGSAGQTRSESGEPEGRAGKLLSPDPRSLQSASRRPWFKPWWAGIALGYGLVYMFLQGTLVVDPSGHLVPVISVFESPIGYGPGLAWAPTTTFGLLLRPYTLAATVALSLFSGLVLTLLLVFLSAGREAMKAVPGPLAGLGVICPTCIGTPATGLFLAYVTPAVAFVGLGPASLFSVTLAISTGILMGTLLLLWVTASWLTRLLSRVGALPHAAGNP